MASQDNATTYLDAVATRLGTTFPEVTVYPYSALVGPDPFAETVQVWVGIQGIPTPAEIQRGDDSQVGLFTGRIHITRGLSTENDDPWRVAADWGATILDWLEHRMMQEGTPPPHVLGLVEPAGMEFVTDQGAYGLAHDPGTAHVTVFWTQEVLIGDPSDRVPGTIDPETTTVDYGVAVTGYVGTEFNR